MSRAVRPKRLFRHCASFDDYTDHDFTAMCSISNDDLNKINECYGERQIVKFFDGEDMNLHHGSKVEQEGEWCPHEDFVWRQTCGNDLLDFEGDVRKGDCNREHLDLLPLCDPIQGYGKVDKQPHQTVEPWEQRSGDIRAEVCRRAAGDIAGKRVPQRANLDAIDNGVVGILECWAVHNVKLR